MPPISTEPVTTLAVPSLWILTTADDCMPALNQNPDGDAAAAIRPVKLRLVVLAVLDRRRGFDEADALDTAARRSAACLP